MIGILNQDKDIDGQTADKHHENIHNSPPRHNDSNSAILVLEELVVEWWEAEVRVVLDLVKALSTPVNRCFGQTDKEWHENQWQEAKDQHADHRQQVA